MLWVQVKASISTGQEGMIMTESPQRGVEAQYTQPLGDLTIVDATASFSGAYAAQLLGDMGAKVLRVEGAGVLRQHPLTLEASLWERGLDHLLHLGKQATGVDLSSAGGREALRDLLRGADLLVEDVGLLEGALPWGDVQALNPALTVVSLSPFGASGPYATYPASDLSLWAWSGLAWTTPGMPDVLSDREEEPPLAPTGVSMAGLSGGMGAVVAALAALAYGDGRGRRVEVSELDVLVTLGYYPINMYDYTRRQDPRGPVLNGPNCILPCKDGWVVLVAINQKHWGTLMEIMGNPDWAATFPDREARSSNWDALEYLLSEWTMERTGHEITEMLQAQRLGAHLLISIREAMASEQVTARQFLRHTTIDGRDVPFPSLPFIFSDIPRPGQEGVRPQSAPAGSDAGRATPVPATAGQGSPRGSSNGEPRLPLEGIRVLDFGQVIAGPFGGRFLAALGADVILVESRMNPFDLRAFPGGADGIPGPNRNAGFNILSQGKRSISLNLSTPQGREIAKRLAAISDVVTDNFSTGMMDRFGLGYEDLKAVNPGVICVSLGAFGRTGPVKQWTGLHSIINAFSGVGDVTGYAGGHRRLLGGPFFPDTLSGTYVTLAVLAALRQRERTGQGRFVDVAMTECMMTLLLEPLLAMAYGDREPQRDGNRNPHYAPHGVYRSQGEDEWVALAVRTEEEWQGLCRALERSDWARDPRYANASARKEREDELDVAITAWTRERSKHEAAAALLEAGVPAAPCLAPREVAEDPHLDVRGSIAPVDHPELGPRRSPSMPMQFDGVVVKPGGPAPLEYQYTAPILRDLLGMTYAEIEDLAHAGVLT